MIKAFFFFGLWKWIIKNRPPKNLANLSFANLLAILTSPYDRKVLREKNPIKIKIMTHSSSLLLAEKMALSKTHFFMNQKEMGVISFLQAGRPIFSSQCYAGKKNHWQTLDQICQLVHQLIKQHDLSQNSFDEISILHTHPTPEYKITSLTHEITLKRPLSLKDHQTLENLKFFFNKKITLKALVSSGQLYQKSI
jgi:hypothetical protein